MTETAEKQNADELLAIIEKLKETVALQERQLALLSDNPWAKWKKNRLSPDEVLRRARERLERHFEREQPKGDYLWHCQIRGMREPMKIYTDTMDRETAIGKLYTKHGIGFNLKKMDLVFIGPTEEKETAA
jgi:hypothetical protein